MASGVRSLLNGVSVRTAGQSTFWEIFVGRFRVLVSWSMQDVFMPGSL